MDVESIFGQVLRCECGRTHRIEPREVVCAEDAIAGLSAVCQRATGHWRVDVLMDVRTRSVAGERAAAALSQAGWRAREVVVEDLPGPRWPVCDDATMKALAGRAREANLIVTVGSGVVTDLGKWLANDACVPFVSFATAASMNGYASANVAPTIGGMKTLVRARPPVAVLACPSILAEAPYEMTAAGLGDALAKSASSADWRLNHLLFGDYYCPRSVALTDRVEPAFLDRPEQILARRPQAVEALFQALLLAGAAMTMAETSAPASGGEHLISHCLDMMSSLDGAAHDLHGRQVGVGTVLASELYRRVLATESPEFNRLPAGVDAAFWGPLEGAVGHQYRQKAPRLEIAAERLSRRDAWDRVRADLAPMLREPREVHECLRRAGAATRADHIRCDRRRLLQAVLHAHEIRSRFTILDLALLVGVLPAAGGEMVEEWA